MNFTKTLPFSYFLDHKKMLKLLIRTLSTNFHSLMTSIKRAVPSEERGQVRQNPKGFVTVWDDVAFHYSLPFTESFTAHPRMVSFFLLPSSPFLSALQEFLSWSLWTPSTWSDVPLWHNECWIFGHKYIKIKKWPYCCNGIMVCDKYIIHLQW